MVTDLRSFALRVGDLSSSFSVVGVDVTDWMLTHINTDQERVIRVRNEREMGVALVS